MRVVVAGATGSVGFQVVQLAKAQGHFVGALSQSQTNAHKLAGIADAVATQDAAVAVPDLGDYDAVISALGAPVTMGGNEKRSYRDVDFAANSKLLEAARQAGIGRFVYVSAHVEPGYRDTAYICAHEDFVEKLSQSGISYTVIRPTGIFPALNDFVHLARKGLIAVIGDGAARTNPVHHADVAGILLENLRSGPAEVSIGGPEIFTRREIAELGFRVLSKRPRVLRIPAAVFRFGAKVAGLANPRMGELLEFVTAVSTTDCVAPALGRLRLEEHFRKVAADSQKTSFNAN